MPKVRRFLRGRRRNNRRGRKNAGQIRYFNPWRAWGQKLNATFGGKREFFITTPGAATTQFIQLVMGSIGAGPSIIYTNNNLDTFTHPNQMNSVCWALNFNPAGTAPNFSNSAEIGLAGAKIVAGYRRWMIKKVRIKVRYEPTNNTAFSGASNILLYMGGMSADQATAGDFAITNAWNDLRLFPYFKVKTNFNSFKGNANAQNVRNLTLKKSFKPSFYNKMYWRDPGTFSGLMTTSATATDPGASTGVINVGLATRDGSAFAVSTTLGNLWVETSIDMQLYEQTILVGQ